MVAVGAAALLELLYSFAPLIGVWAANRAARTGQRDASVVYALADHATLAGVLLAYSVAGGLFIVWLYSCCVNVKALTDVPAWSPAGLAIGGWFIPLANLVLPGLIVASVARRSAPPDQEAAGRRAQRLVWAWWGTYLVAVVAQTVGAVATRSPELDRIRASMAGGSTFEVDLAVSLFLDQVTGRLVGAVAVLAAAVLLIIVIHRITASQYDRFDALRAPAAPLVGATIAG